MLKKIPRSLFVVDHFFYRFWWQSLCSGVCPAHADGLSLGDLASLVALIAIFGLCGGCCARARPKTCRKRHLVHARDQAFAQARAAGLRERILPKCMALGGQVLRLEKSHPKDLKIIG